MKQLIAALILAVTLAGVALGGCGFAYRNGVGGSQPEIAPSEVQNRVGALNFSCPGGSELDEAIYEDQEFCMGYFDNLFFQIVREDLLPGDTSLEAAAELFLDANREVDSADMWSKEFVGQLQINGSTWLAYDVFLLDGELYRQQHLFALRDGSLYAVGFEYLQAEEIYQQEIDMITASLSFSSLEVSQPVFQDIAVSISDDGEARDLCVDKIK